MRGVKYFCPTCAHEVPLTRPFVCPNCGASYTLMSAILANWKVVLGLFALIIAWCLCVMYGLYKAGGL